MPCTRQVVSRRWKSHHGTSLRLIDFFTLLKVGGEGQTMNAVFLPACLSATASML